MDRINQSAADGGVDATPAPSASGSPLPVRPQLWESTSRWAIVYRTVTAPPAGSDLTPLLFPAATGPGVPAPWGVASWAPAERQATP